MDQSTTEAQPVPPPNLTMYARFRRLFAIDEKGEFSHPRASTVLKMTFAGTLSGLMIGTRIGARVGGVEHIEHSMTISQKQVHRSPTHAKRMYIDKVIMKGLKNGAKLGWRVGFVSGLYGTLLMLLCEKYPTCPGLSFLVAGTVAGSVSGGLLLRTLRGYFAGGVIAGGFTLPFAALVGGAGTMVRWFNLDADGLLLFSGEVIDEDKDK